MVKNEESVNKFFNLWSTVLDELKFQAHELNWNNYYTKPNIMIARRYLKQIIKKRSDSDNMFVIWSICVVILLFYTYSQMKHKKSRIIFMIDASVS